MYFALTHNSTILPMYHHTLRHHHRLLSRAPPPPQRDETNKTPHLILDTSSSLDPPLRGFPVEVHSHTPPALGYSYYTTTSHTLHLTCLNNLNTCFQYGWVTWSCIFVLAVYFLPGADGQPKVSTVMVTAGGHLTLAILRVIQTASPSFISSADPSQFSDY